MATDIGTTIKRARERKRWSQRELAARLGVDRKTVDNWEHGRTRPASSIGALEEVLGISLGEDAPAPPPVPPELAAYPELVDEVRRSLPDPADQERVMAAIAATVRGEPPPTSPGAEAPSREQRRAG